jgi:hypothetical protein
MSVMTRPPATRASSPIRSPAPGAWHALAHYNGDANHAPAQATCPFTVAPDDFQISVNPSSGSVQQGSSIDATVETAWP